MTNGWNYFGGKENTLGYLDHLFLIPRKLKTILSPTLSAWQFRLVRNSHHPNYFMSHLTKDEQHCRYCSSQNTQELTFSSRRYQHSTTRPIAG